MKKILYGVGEAILSDLKDPKQFLTFSKLQNLTINFGADTSEIHGGDDPYPITEFPRTTSITVTAQDALFDTSHFLASQGAVSKQLTEFEMLETLNVRIPTEGTIDLPSIPTADGVIIDGFRPTEMEPGRGEYTILGTTLTFNKDDINEDINGYYYTEVNADITDIAGIKGKFPKPFKFIHTIPVYNDENQVIGRAQLTIYKCKSDSNFEFGLQPQTGYAPQLTLKAFDPKRPDKKLWDFVYIPQDPTEADFGTIG